MASKVTDIKESIRVRLEQADIEYHSFIIKQMQNAQLVSQNWGQYLTQKYKLEQGDQINEHGEIIKKS